MLAADRVFRGGLLLDQMGVHGGADRREARAGCAHALQQLDDEGRVGLGGSGGGATEAGGPARQAANGAEGFVKRGLTAAE